MFFVWNIHKIKNNFNINKSQSILFWFISIHYMLKHVFKNHSVITTYICLTIYTCLIRFGAKYFLAYGNTHLGILSEIPKMLRRCYKFPLTYECLNQNRGYVLTGYIVIFLWLILLIIKYYPFYLELLNVVPLIYKSSNNISIIW